MSNNNKTLYTLTGRRIYYDTGNNNNYNLDICIVSINVHCIIIIIIMIQRIHTLILVSTC